MPVAQTPFPPAPPTISSTTGDITISAWLQNPARVTRVLRNLALERFLADVIFARGPQTGGGAVLYDQVDANYLYTDRDAREIAAGAEFPIVTEQEPVPKLASVKKWGGRGFITFEDRDRNRFDKLQRELIKLTNTIIKKVDGVAIAALDAAPIRTYTGADWSTTSNDIIAQLVAARALVDDSDLGYMVDTVLINPAQEIDLLGRKDFREALSDASQDAIVRGANVGRILNMDFIKSNRVTAGTAYLLPRRMVGGISDEQPLATRTYETPENERIWFQGSRRLVPYVTDPLAVVKMSSI